MSDAREEFEVYCIHSMVKWWCIGCVQGHARRVERENARLRSALVAAGVRPGVVDQISQPDSKDEVCTLCEGVGEVAKNFGAYGPGRPEIVACPKCRPVTETRTDV